MKKVYFQRWVFGKIQDVQTSIEVLDGYNKTKFSLKKNKDKQLLLEAAKYAHNNQKLYFVTILENEKPYCYLEINKGFYRVNFFDELSRIYLAYTFLGEDNLFEWRKNYGNRLLLEDITFWEFEGNTDKVIKTSNHIFKPDGSFHMIERDLITNQQMDSEAKNKIDVSSNWEDYPVFGDYKKLIVKERLSTESEIKDSNHFNDLSKNNTHIKKNGFYHSKEPKHYVDSHAGHENKTNTYYFFKFFENNIVARFSSQDLKFDVDAFLAQNPDYVLEQKGRYQVLDTAIEMIFGEGQFAVQRNFKIITPDLLEDENSQQYSFFENTDNKIT